MQFKRIAIALTGAAAVVGLAACGGSDSGASTSSATPPPATGTTAPATSSEAAASAEFGAACSKVPTSGPGSFQGMAQAPVATAASSNPVLSTLVSAVTKAKLVDTLNSAKDITVFAPANAAFEKIPDATLKKVLADKDTLTKILTYHVVGQKVTPEQLADGNFKTLEGDMVKTSGSGEDFTVNGDAHVVCGNVQTANATVYIIDGVLMPPSS